MKHFQYIGWITKGNLDSSSGGIKSSTSGTLVELFLNPQFLFWKHLSTAESNTESLLEFQSSTTGTSKFHYWNYRNYTDNLQTSTTGTQSSTAGTIKITLLIRKVPLLEPKVPSLEVSKLIYC